MGVLLSRSKDHIPIAEPASTTDSSAKSNKSKIQEAKKSGPPTEITPLTKEKSTKLPNYTQTHEQHNFQLDPNDSDGFKDD